MTYENAVGSEKLLYISKSKKESFDKCPLMFKFSYIDRLERGENPYFSIGTDVHEFIDQFFDKVEPEKGGALRRVSELQFHPNTEYRKNVTKFEIERWKLIDSLGFDDTFFKPVIKEKKYITEIPQLIGVVDRVHKCCKQDPFAPKHPEFQDGDLVIVENKTGKPTAEKCQGYINDLVWYKIILEISKPEIPPIRWGAVYFPYSNYIFHAELKDEHCRKLSSDIRQVRATIKESIDKNEWRKDERSGACHFCSFRKQCKEVKQNV
jgi:CRISPR/Cas system-associated exonuclease Cas4 (RecB family)